MSLGVLVGSRVALAGVGFVEYATRHLFLNPKVIASNQLEDYFRVNSLFFDPNIYGRFLAVTMLLAAAWLLWTRRAARRRRRPRRCWPCSGAALVLTFSQSSFAALLAGLAVLGGAALAARGRAVASRRWRAGRRRRLRGARARRRAGRPRQLGVRRRGDERAL